MAQSANREEDVRQNGIIIRVVGLFHKYFEREIIEPISLKTLHLVTRKDYESAIQKIFLFELEIGCSNTLSIVPIVNLCFVSLVLGGVAAFSVTK